MSTEDRDERDGMDPQADEALWTLLGRQAPPKSVSPYFARRVLREVGLSTQGRVGGWQVWRRQWLPFASGGRSLALWSGALSGVCALSLVCLVEMRQATAFHPGAGKSKTEASFAQSTPDTTINQDVGTGESPAADDQSVPVQEDEVIADLDNILQREESRLWTDDTSSTARF